MDKNNKKGTIKDILNKDNLKDNFTDSSKSTTNNDENSSLGSEIYTKQNDTSNDISNVGKSSSMDEHSDASRDDNASGTSDNTNNFYIDIMVLNEISRACQLAMSNISFLSSRISNKNMKKDLVSIYSQYANVLLQVDQHFENYGEIPENVPSSLKMMGICGIKMNTKFDRSNSHIAEIMIQGENMGIIKCQKILNNNYDIKKSTTELLESFKNFQKENISKLNLYL